VQVLYNNITVSKPKVKCIMLPYCVLFSQKSKESNKNVRVIEEDSKKFCIQVQFVGTFLHVTEIMHLRKQKRGIILIPLQFMTFI
jgi:hypothetical protein